MGCNFTELPKYIQNKLTDMGADFEVVEGIKFYFDDWIDYFKRLNIYDAEMEELMFLLIIGNGEK